MKTSRRRILPLFEYHERVHGQGHKLQEQSCVPGEALKRREGQFDGSIRLLKHPEIKNKLMIDEETAWVVRKIFDLSLQGMGASKIVKTLMEEQVPSPGWVQYTRSGACARFFAGQPEAKKFAWSPTQVKNILKDETYIGNTVHHRQGTVSYKNKRVVRNPQEKWLRVEGTHEAIISQEVFETVQEQRAKRRRECRSKQTQIFAGLLKCADCGWSMRYSLRSNVKKPYAFFNCGSYRDYHRINGKCSPDYIRYDTLCAYVLARIRHWSAQAQQDDGKLLAQLRMLAAGNGVPLKRNRWRN